MADIDWTNPSVKVSSHFSVRECLWLPSWGRMANESDGLNDEVKNNLIELCAKMDIVREFLGVSINIHVTYRPEAYNKQIGGASHSKHFIGSAMDWDASGMNCDDVRARLEPMLEQLDMRMEKLPQSGWVHLDTGNVPSGGHRYFIP